MSKSLRDVDGGTARDDARDASPTAASGASRSARDPPLLACDRSLVPRVCREKDASLVARAADVSPLSVRDSAAYASSGAAPHSASRSERASASVLCGTADGTGRGAWRLCSRVSREKVPATRLAAAASGLFAGDASLLSSSLAKLRAREPDDGCRERARSWPGVYVWSYGAPFPSMSGAYGLAVRLVDDSVDICDADMSIDDEDGMYDRLSESFRRNVRTVLLDVSPKRRSSSAGVAMGALCGGGGARDAYEGAGTGVYDEDGACVACPTSLRYGRLARWSGSGAAAAPSIGGTGTRPIACRRSDVGAWGGLGWGLAHCGSSMAVPLSLGIACTADTAGSTRTTSQRGAKAACLLTQRGCGAL